MKLTRYESWRTGRLGTLCLMTLGMLLTPVGMAHAQGLSTTTVQGTVYLANGQAGAGTLMVSWPAFTTATGQAVAADSTTVTISLDGFVSVNLAPNVGSFPAGEYYTAVFYMSDGSVSTQYWQVPAGAQATLAQVQTQVMPAAQAVQAVSKSYVDQSITELTESLLTASGGTLSGPLNLNADPTQEMQAADKHYVDTQVATDVPLAGGNMTGALGTPAVNGVQAPAAGSAQTTLQQAINAAGTNGAMEIPPAYAGTDTFTNANGVKVTDLRTGGAQQTERSVKEFGAVCDGVTDDTNALQAALNYANAHGVALTIPEGTCKTRSLNWHGESIGGMGKQVSALMGFPGQDVLASMTDSTNLRQYTRLHDLTIYVDQSVDVSCSAAEGRAAAGSCQVSRLMEKNSIFSPGGNGLTATAGSGAGWAVGNCAIAMPAATGTGGNGLLVAEIENLEIATTGVDPMAAQYPGAHSTHTCGMYLAQWPQWSEFRNIDIRGLNTGIAIPALPVTTPAGLRADSNRWQNITIQATHAFTVAAGCNGVLDTLEAEVGNSAAMGEPPTGLVLDLPTGQQGWTVRNAVVMPSWNGVAPSLTVTAAGGAVTAVTLGTEHGLGWDPYGVSVPVAFSGSCTAQATATVSSNGSIGSVSVTQGGVGCSSTTTASVNAAGTWDTAAPVNLVSGSSMTFFAGNLVKGNGGYTVWNASGAQSFGTQLSGGGGNLPGGGSYPALVASSSMGSTLEADQFPGADIGAKIQACLGAVSASYGGTCDARNFTGNLSMASNLTISTGNTTVLLPCATITTANQVIVTAGTRNVALRGCALRGGSATNGSQGGTAFAYSGTGAMVQVGDPTYATDTMGFHMDNVVINTTAATSASAKGLIAYRTQEMDLESLYLLGNGNQTGITLDGTGNYTGGTFLDNEIGGFQTAVNAIGHQVSNPAMTDWMNASAFVRLHIDCPTSAGSPISGTYGINLQQGDGNTFTGGDVEGCSTALHLGANAQNNTIVGLRNENSTSQVVADAGSSYNNWMTGGTMFTGQLTDNGTRNSFLDTFHRSFNGLKGDWYGSQQDATVTNHYRLGIGTGNERGLLNEVQTDYGYRWLEGYSDATAGEQFYQVEDLLNSVNRLSIGQYNNGQSSTNNQTVINAAGTGAVVLNGSNNAGSGGVVIGSGGASEATVATISNAGNAQFNGTLQVGSTAQSSGTMTVRNSADAEVDYYLWPGLTGTQKGSFTYKDWNGNSQWYLVKDTSNNWAVNSAVGGLDSFKAYQSTNSGDTYIDASNSTGHIRMNYETGAGAETDIYSGSSSNLDAAFLSPTSIKLPGLAAGSGQDCLQIDNSGYITNTGSSCGTGSGGTNGTVNSGTTGQIAYYTSNGTAVGGMNTIPMTSGGTGAATASAGLANLGGVSTAGGTMSGQLNGTSANFSGQVSTGASISTTSPDLDMRAYGAVINGTTPIDSALSSAAAACPSGSGTGGVACTILLPCGGAGCYLQNGSILGAVVNSPIKFKLQGNLHLGSTFVPPASLDLTCDAGGPRIQFQSGVASCSVVPPQVAGTLGTAVTSTNTPVSFTPTFTSGSIASFQPGSVYGSAITIAGYISCSATASRTSGGNNNTVFTFGSSCRIPQGTTATVAGCSDPTLDVVQAVVTQSDYTAETLTITQSGSTTTGTGCTVAGFNEDTFETVRIQSVAGSSATGVFAHQHASTDQFGMVAIATAHVQQAQDNFTGLEVYNCAGACFWEEFATNVTIRDSGFQASKAITSIPMEIDQGYRDSIDNTVLETGFVGGSCAGSCGTAGYPWGLRCTVEGSYLNPVNESACGFTQIDQGSTVFGGIKLDTNDVVAPIGAPEIENSVIDQPVGNIIDVDMRYSNANYFMPPPILRNVSINDIAYPYNVCWIGYEDLTGPRGSVTMEDLPYGEACLANKYYSGTMPVKGMPYSWNFPYDKGVAPGTFDDGIKYIGEFDGISSGFGPSLIPYATLAVTPPGSLTCSGTGCLITTGVYAPDTSSNAITLTTGSSGSSSIVAATYTGTTSANDWFLGISWVQYASNDVMNAPLQIYSYSSSDQFSFAEALSGNCGGQCANSLGFDSSVQNFWVHPIVFAGKLSSGSGTSHPVQLRLQGPSNVGGATSFWGYNLIHIPASAGLTDLEVERIRQNLLHGCIPPNYNGPNIPATCLAIATAGYDVLNPTGGAPLSIIPSTATLPYVGFKTYSGSGTPSDTCSATADTGAIEINATPTAYQCSNATGSYAWNAFTGGGGSMTWPSGGAGIPNYNGSSGWGTSYSAGNQIPAAFIPTLNQSTTGSAGSVSLSGVTGLGTGVATALSVNTGSAGAPGILIATGTAAMGTSAISSGSCAAVVTVSASGVAATDVIETGFNGDPTAVTGYGASATGAVLTIYPYPTSGGVNFKVCNSTSASITPGSLTLNWKVYR